MRVLVTGATGFIGRYVVLHLLSCGHSVIATGRKSSQFNQQGAEYIPKNLNDRENDYYSFFKKPDFLIHLSWEGLPNYQEFFHIERNLPANFYFIKNMVEHGLCNVTVVGTCFEYGLQNGYRTHNLVDDMSVFEISEVNASDNIGVIIALNGVDRNEVLPMLKEKGFKNTILFMK